MGKHCWNMSRTCPQCGDPNTSKFVYLYRGCYCLWLGPKAPASWSVSSHARQVEDVEGEAFHVFCCLGHGHLEPNIFVCAEADTYVLYIYIDLWSDGCRDVTPPLPEFHPRFVVSKKSPRCLKCSPLVHRNPVPQDGKKSSKSSSSRWTASSSKSSSVNKIMTVTTVWRRCGRLGIFLESFYRIFSRSKKKGVRRYFLVNN